MPKPSESEVGLEICVLTDVARLSETHEAFRTILLNYNIVIVIQNKKEIIIIDTQSILGLLG